MPGGYTMETLPQPKNMAIKLKSILRARFVVIRFSGSPQYENLQTRSQQLRAFINESA